MNDWLLPVAHAGVITDATPVSRILGNVLNFLLSVIAIVGIIGMVVAGAMYLNASGDEKRMRFAKNGFFFSLVGVVIALGALVIATQIGRMFS